MAITPGTRIGPYEVLSVLGAGGMGEVFRARDTKLNRDVALKVLRPDVDGHADRTARFRREAQTLAALNHPHIAAIYGFEEAGGISALVLELVEGQTLADRIAAGRLPLGEALAIARQIAEALEAAHEKGILHRDLKPANVSITPDGRVKVLDFGLAKVLDTAEHGASTVTAFRTGTGFVMGTPAYMSPEQARGDAVGRQTDIWAFGGVLYELLTGVCAFGRQSTAETLAQVLSAQPDFARLPAATPAAVGRLLRRCLEKDPKRRLQHIGDARIELEDAASSDERSIEGPPPAIVRARGFRWLVIAALLLVATAGFTGWRLARGGPADSAPLPTRASLPFAEPPAGYAFGINRIAISRDGSTVAYVGSNRLWVRRLDRKDAVAVGTGHNPFFSPDGSSVGFFRDGDGLISVPVTGGTPVRIARHAGRPQGAVWSEDGTIVFATSEGLFRLPVEGGEPKLLKAPDRGRNETSYGWPELLPGGQTVMFTIVRDTQPRTEIATLDLATGEVRSAWAGGSFARRAADGRFVFAAGTTLRAVTFDLDSRRASPPVAVPDVEVAYAGDNGVADFALSATGTLVFIPPGGARNNLLEWIDQTGRREPVALAPGGYFYPRISPDGTRVALDVGGRGERDIWILDLARLSLARLSDGPTEDMLAVWSTDGTRLFYSSNRNGNFDVYSQPADGAAPARPESTGPGDQIVDQATPDGSRLLIQENFGQKATLLDLARRDHSVSLFEDRFEDRLFQVSHDGKWVAYESNESGGGFEIVLRSFPDTSSRRVQISSGGGRYPKWGPKGSNELYYVAADGSMMAVPVALAPDVKIGESRKLFDFEKPPEARSGLVYDVSPLDGRFLTVKTAPLAGNGQNNVSIVLNWTGELRRLLGD